MVEAPIGTGSASAEVTIDMKSVSAGTLMPSTAIRRPGAGSGAPVADIPSVNGDCAIRFVGTLSAADALGEAGIDGAVIVGLVCPLVWMKKKSAAAVVAAIPPPVRPRWMIGLNRQPRSSVGDAEPAAATSAVSGLLQAH